MKKTLVHKPQIILLTLCVGIGCIILISIFAKEDVQNKHNTTFPSTQVINPLSSLVIQPEPSKTQFQIIPTEDTRELSKANAKAKLSQLLKRNGNCQLPCFWGITPGMTTFEEAKSILVPLKLISDDSEFEPPLGSIDVDTELADLNMLIKIKYRIEEKGIDQTSKIAYLVIDLRAIERAMINGEPSSLEIFKSDLFAKEIEYYSLSEVLNQLGIPKEVKVQTISRYPPAEQGIRPPSYMHLVLIYPNEGVFVEYLTDISINNDQVTGCFNAASVEFDLYKKVSRTTETFIEELSQTWVEALPYYLPIEKATQYSRYAFYEKFKQTGDGCIVTPAKLWPRPD